MTINPPLLRPISEQAQHGTLPLRAPGMGKHRAPKSSPFLKAEPSPPGPHKPNDTACPRDNEGTADPPARCEQDKPPPGAT